MGVSDKMSDMLSLKKWKAQESPLLPTYIPRSTKNSQKLQSLFTSRILISIVLLVTTLIAAMYVVSFLANNTQNSRSLFGGGSSTMRHTVISVEGINRVTKVKNFFDKNDNITKTKLVYKKGTVTIYEGVAPKKLSERNKDDTHTLEFKNQEWSFNAADVILHRPDSISNLHPLSNNVIDTSFMMNPDEKNGLLFDKLEELQTEALSKKKENEPIGDQELEDANAARAAAREAAEAAQPPAAEEAQEPAEAVPQEAPRFKKQLKQFDEVNELKFDPEGDILDRTLCPSTYTLSTKPVKKEGENVSECTPGNVDENCDTQCTLKIEPRKSQTTHTVDGETIKLPGPPESNSPNESVQTPVDRSQTKVFFLRDVKERHDYLRGQDVYSAGATDLFAVSTGKVTERCEDTVRLAEYLMERKQKDYE